MFESVKRIETKLNCLIDCLEKENIEYSINDFKNDVKRIENAIYESFFVDLITEPEYRELWEMVTFKTIKYFNKSN